MKPQTILLLLVTLALVVLAGYVLNDKYQESKALQLQNATLQGYNYGYSKALTDIFGVVSECKSLPLSDGNRNVTLIAGECLGK